MVFDSIIPWRTTSVSSKPEDPFEPTPLLRLAFQSPVKLLLYHTYRTLTSLCSQPSPLTPPIRVVCISDTHNNLPNSSDVPHGDILIHAGDMTVDGSIEQIQKQVDWLASLPHKEIIAIGGNHDTYLDPRTRPSLREDQRNGAIDWKRVHYLQHRRLSLNITLEPLAKDEAGNGSIDSSTRLLSREARQRRIVVYGAPQIPACGPMSVHAFQYPRGLDAWSETVPAETDILVTHTPPKYHRDLPLPSGMGCEHLAAEVKRVKPTLHVFGHVHWGAGQEVVWWDGCHDAYEKGMGMKVGWMRGLLSPWLWLCAVRVLYRGLRELAWDRIWGGQGERTVLVNAAQMRGNTGQLGNAVQIVDI
ncbi:Metallo-dependent phosphatase [Periconia macrospinosa]|uniref:Metallo-dependent phosphatase n=1 Tax=Periconia macrospinosa TaxID=97972 RepID=A0A2V1E2V0_9PLEO|nr:Metallo-dependent phosphatase [Periconia macrospinosa]